jgi:hypothetical protein
MPSRARFSGGYQSTTPRSHPVSHSCCGWPSPIPAIPCESVRHRISPDRMKIWWCAARVYVFQRMLCRLHTGQGKGSTKARSLRYQQGCRHLVVAPAGVDRRKDGGAQDAVQETALTTHPRRWCPASLCRVRRSGIFPDSDRLSTNILSLLIHRTKRISFIRFRRSGCSQARVT